MLDKKSANIKLKTVAQVLTNAADIVTIKFCLYRSQYKIHSNKKNSYEKVKKLSDKNQEPILARKTAECNPNLVLNDGSKI